MPTVEPKHSAAVLYGVEDTLTQTPGATRVVLNTVDIDHAVVMLHASWQKVVQVQTTGDRDAKSATVRAAGRRAVDRYGAALERLAQ
jgi:hypothetical protein